MDFSVKRESKRINFRLKSRMDRTSANLHNPVSKGRTLRYGVRYTRKNQKNDFSTKSSAYIFDS